MTKVAKQCAQLGMEQPGFATRVVKLNTYSRLITMAASPSSACARRSASFLLVVMKIGARPRIAM